MTLGFVAFPLSPRNSAAVTAHLLQTTGVSLVFVSEDAAMQALAAEAVKILSAKGVDVQATPMVKLIDVKANIGSACDVVVTDIADDDVTFILHSSGKSNQA